MYVKVNDFLEKYSGDFRIEDNSGSIYCDCKDGLTPELLSKEITDIKLERTMWTGKSGEVVLIIK